MTETTDSLAPFLAEPSPIGTEISITGKWVPTKPGGRFRTTNESADMLAEWEEIHAGARASDGVLSTEINHAIGQDAVLVHHVFRDADALVSYFNTTATDHLAALTKVAKPQLHLVRGIEVPEKARKAIRSKGTPVVFAEWLFGYVKNHSQRPNQKTAVQVTAKWACVPGGDLDELTYWWQRVGTDAHSMEKGLVRFETYAASDENALVIHETFSDSDELKFHLTKGTAAKYKKDIDKIAAPEEYYFRGPVSWSIRTYSKFMHLPATYSSQGSRYAIPGGNLSDGLDAH